MKQPERRLESRFLCADLVRVSWAADDGFHEADGNLEDVAPSGCRLLMDEGIPEKTSIAIRCDDTLFLGTVQYCHPGEIGFDLGIEFDQIGAWERGKFEPRHLLDVRKLRAEPE